MRKQTLLIACVTVLLSLCSFAQTKEADKAKEPPTKLEAFLARKGRLVIKDSYELGGIRGTGKLDLDALAIYEPGAETQKTKGIRIQITEAGRLETSNTSFLDLDEVETSSKAISYMLDTANKWKTAGRDAYSEVIYSTKGDFKLGFYQKASERGAFASSGYVGKADAFFELEELLHLKALLDKGLTVLGQK